jgi:hypothetical protein
VGTEKGIFDDWDLPRGKRSKQDRIRLESPKNSSGKNSYGGIGGVSQQPNYHLSISVISRGKGHSSTAAAAYRTGSLIVDERTGDIHDFRRKTRVEYSEIVALPGTPAWAMDRSALWNEAERKERVNGCVAREWQIAIPRGFTEQQAISLTRELSEEIVDRHKIVVEFSIHKDNPKNWDGSEKGADGFHAHILGTTRRIGPNGFGEKSRELDDRKPQPERNNRSRGQEEVIWWRARYAALANHALEKSGRIERIDHRSNLARGITRLAQPKLGPALTKMARENKISCENPGRSEVIGRWKTAGEGRAHLLKLGEVWRELREINSELAIYQAEVRKLAKTPIRKEKLATSNTQEVETSAVDKPTPVQPDDLIINAQQVANVQQEAERLFPGRPDKQGRYFKVFAAAVEEARIKFPGNKAAQVQFIDEVAARLREAQKKSQGVATSKPVPDRQADDLSGQTKSERDEDEKER